MGGGGMGGGSTKWGGQPRPSCFALAALPPLHRRLERYVGGRLLEGGSKRGGARRGFSSTPKIEKKGADDDIFQNLLLSHPDFCTCLLTETLSASCIVPFRRPPSQVND